SRVGGNQRVRLDQPPRPLQGQKATMTEIAEQIVGLDRVYRHQYRLADRPRLRAPALPETAEPLVPSPSTRSHAPPSRAAPTPAASRSRARSFGKIPTMSVRGSTSRLTRSSGLVERSFGQ